ncbi:MAG: hypothetical protein ACOC2P_02170 [Spirochaetota bacterium]
MKIGLILCVLFFGFELLCAEIPPAGTASQGWLEWSMNLDESKPPKDMQSGEYQDLLRTLDRIGRLFREMPHLNPPQGVEIVPSRRIFDRVGAEYAHRWGVKSTDTRIPDVHPLKQSPYPGKQLGPLRGEFGLSIYRPVYRHNNPQCGVRVQINDPWLEGRVAFEDELGGIYLSWPRLENKNGRIRYQIGKNTVVEKILPPGRSVWLPVSQERWIEALISASEATLAERRSAIVEQSESRRSNFMRSYEMMKSIDSEQAEQMLTTFEKNEAIYARHAEAIAAEDFEALEEAGERGLAMLGRHMVRLREELSALSPAERAAPAYGLAGNPMQYWMPRNKRSRPSLLLDRDDPNAMALVAPNHDFFRSDSDPTDIQSITVINKLWDDFDAQMQAEFNWDELEGMLR